jgi:hypothetical protein
MVLHGSARFCTVFHGLGRCEMLEKALAAVLKAIMGYIAMWLQAKKAERLEVKVKKMESAIKAKDIERKLERELNQRLSADLMEETGAVRIDTPSAWNRGRGTTIPMVFLVLALALAALSCVKYVESRWVILPVPARPAVPTDPPEWTAREKILAKYAGALEGLIDGYNAEAKQHNQEHGYDD